MAEKTITSDELFAGLYNDLGISVGGWQSGTTLIDTRGSAGG